MTNQELLTRIDVLEKKMEEVLNSCSCIEMAIKEKKFIKSEGNYKISIGDPEW